MGGCHDGNFSNLLLLLLYLKKAEVLVFPHLLNFKFHMHCCTLISTNVKRGGRVSTFSPVAEDDLNETWCGCESPKKTPMGDPH